MAVEALGSPALSCTQPRIVATTFFETGEGPGVVNAPVMPDVIYAGRGGARPGLSVVDLNGYGQSTGNPITTFPSPLEGESRFPFDPNVTISRQD